MNQSTKLIGAMLRKSQYISTMRAASAESGGDVATPPTSGIEMWRPAASDVEVNLISGCSALRRCEMSEEARGVLSYLSKQMARAVKVDMFKDVLSTSTIIIS